MGQGRTPRMNGQRIHMVTLLTEVISECAHATSKISLQYGDSFR